MSDLSVVCRLEVRIATLENELSQTKRRKIQHRRVLKRLLGLGAAAVLVGAAVASAAPSVTLNCPGGELFCFTANMPAKSSEVNHNFAKTKAWIEQKVGAAGTAEVRIQTGSTSNQTTAAGKPLFVSGAMESAAQGVEFRSDNLTQGIGFGYNTIYATGSNANQDLYLQARGTGGVRMNSPLFVDGKLISTYLRDYIRGNCRIYIGWIDGCETCGSSPSRWSSITPNGAAANCTQSADTQRWCTNDGWAMIGFSGEMDANENIGIKIECN